MIIGEDWNEDLQEAERSAFRLEMTDRYTSVVLRINHQPVERCQVHF